LREGLRRFRFQAHFVYYTVSTGTVEIRGVLHHARQIRPSLFDWRRGGDVDVPSLEGRLIALATAYVRRHSSVEVNQVQCSPKILEPGLWAKHLNIREIL
jgi:hypothetical protein